MRAANERLVLSLVRKNGALAKSDLARMTGLSTQTVSVIMRRLEADRLLQRGEPQRGRVGQPSVPLSLDPDGAFFIGVKVGRRSLEVVLVDFCGGVRYRSSEAYAYPRPDLARARILGEVRACERTLGEAAPRIAGIGVAMPFALWNWASALHAPAEALQAWRETDLRADLTGAVPFPVYLENDATAACGAELAFGTHPGLRDFVYFYIATFIGGGVVLNGALFRGRSGNAAALGSIPVPGPDGGTRQLIDRASLFTLERRLLGLGHGPDALFGPEADWSAFVPEVEAWTAAAGASLAHAIVAAAAVIDFEAAVIDGAFPQWVQERLVTEIGAAMSAINTAGIEAPRLLGGSIGSVARALGGASLPLFDRFLDTGSAAGP